MCIFLENFMWWGSTLTCWTCWGAVVTVCTSRIICSKAEVSSACFCVWSAIFSLNFLGFAIVHIFLCRLCFSVIIKLRGLLKCFLRNQNYLFKGTGYRRSKNLYVLFSLYVNRISFLFSLMSRFYGAKKCYSILVMRLDHISGRFEYDYRSW